METVESGADTFAVHVAVYGGLEHTWQSLQSVIENTTGPFVLRLWDNDSDPATADFLTELSERYENIVLYHSPRNVGFGWAHNSMVRDASETVVCILNSDVSVGDDWNTLPQTVLRSDVRIGAVGAVKAAFHQTQYVEGSCLFMRRAVAEAFGPFDARRFHLAYCEDADLSARLVTAGYRLAAVPVNGWRHENPGSTMQRMEAGKNDGEDNTDNTNDETNSIDSNNTINSVDLRGIMVCNQQAFLKRWPRRPRPARILLRRDGAIGDVLCLTPALAAFANQNPTVDVVVQTVTHAVLQRNPHIAHVERVYGPRDQGSDPPDINLNQIVEQDKFATSGRHAVDLFADALGVTLADTGRSPQIFLAPEERAWAQSAVPFPYIVFATDTGWAIKDWPHWIAFTQAVGKRWPDTTVVWAGTRRLSVLPAPLGVVDLRGATSVRQVFSLLAGARLVVTADTGMLHAAAAFDRPTIALFGPVLSAIRIHAEQIALDTALTCRGCYHRQQVGVGFHEHACLRQGLRVLQPGVEGAPCMTSITPERVLHQMEEMTW